MTEKNRKTGDDTHTLASSMHRSSRRHQAAVQRYLGHAACRPGVSLARSISKQI